MLSSENGASEVVNLLLKHGWNLDHQANDGNAVLMITNHSRHFHVAKLFLKAGANPKQQTKEGPALTQQCYTKVSNLHIKKRRKGKKLMMELNRYHNRLTDTRNRSGISTQSSLIGFNTHYKLSALRIIKIYLACKWS